MLGVSARSFLGLAEHATKADASPALIFTADGMH